jgi:hypothetical protein
MMEPRIAGKMGAVGVLPGRWSGGQGRQGAPVAAGGPTSQPGAIRLRHGPPGRKRVADSVVSQDECFTCVGVRRGDRGVAARVERALAGGKRDSCDCMEFTEQA